MLKRLSSLLRWVKASIRRVPSLPTQFLSCDFEVISDSHILEEERFKDFKLGKYYPVNIGAMYLLPSTRSLAKLGFGITSTVWLASLPKCSECWAHRPKKASSAGWDLIGMSCLSPGKTVWKISRLPEALKRSVEHEDWLCRGSIVRLGRP
ncbi:uncharacterized protein CIMG_13417 [Coccidioides immitis RS]|uniref:Uncharacterized protein n=1 Tax=Coccidioides immitis (strain RS) TaxID=246410 RepID=A0A0D8JW09_COCIM|nr:uncharacterized protein CIMG_13417 [Coccidioides immitis RS]KJF61101.1 hypothetical protein CIMG_13417 [Coccidioides immitis RS]